MASNWLSIDNNMPTITGRESTWQMVMQLHKRHLEKMADAKRMQEIYRNK